MRNTSQDGAEVQPDEVENGVHRPPFPEPAGSLSSAAREPLDRALAELQMRKGAWVASGIDERIAILDEIGRDMLAVAERWVAAGLEAKGIPQRTLGEGEEWALLGGVFRILRLLRRSLVDIRQYGQPQIPGAVATRQNGQTVAQVFPQTPLEKILFRGIVGEVWMEPGITPEQAIRTRARIYQDKNHAGKVVLVLGAGNASTLLPTDFLYKLFVEDQVVALKCNPVNAYLGPLVEEGFRALIRRGFLRVVYGGVDAGAYLCHHPAIEELHLTGSDQTFEAITFGQGAEGARRKANRAPLITKRFTAELGNISPVIIVPGPWSARQVKAQAVQLATMLVANAGFNCMTPRLIIQHKNWGQREALVKAIAEALSSVQTRRAYYPGAKERHEAFLAAHPEAMQFGNPGGDRLPWTLIADVAADNPSDICFQTEAYCSLFAETALEAEDIPDFLRGAVEFANETLWGTLAATLIVHPASLDDPQVAAAVDGAIAGLSYGTVAVNLFPAYGYYFMLTPWGAFPGHDIDDVQSGIGVTNNVLMFARPQKAVWRAPFMRAPDPFTVRSKRAHQFGRKLAYFEASPSAWKLPGMIWTALWSQAAARKP